MGKSREERHLWFEQGEEQDVHMHLMPPDSISQAASNAVLNQNSRGRSCGLCYICDYMGMPQGRQYSSFLSNPCSIHPSNVRFGRLENGQLSWSNGRGIIMTKKGEDVVSGP